jgi:FAD/FMN-containing dehydrogenase
LPQGWLLAVEVAGAEAGVERSRREVLAVARDAGCLAALDLDPEERERLSAGIRDFGCAEEPSGLAVGSDTALLARAAVLPSRVAEVCRLLLAEGEPQVLARAGTGVVYAAWPESAAGELHHRISRLRGALQAHGGVLVLERCPPSLKQLGVDVWGITGADVALMRRIKREFDPAGILSPGRGPGEN